MKATDEIDAAPPSTLWLVLAVTAPWSRSAAMDVSEVRLIPPPFSSSAFAAIAMPSVSSSAVTTV